MAWTTCERDGKLAITLGWGKDYHTPSETCETSISTIDADRWTGLMGRAVEFTGNIAVIWIDNRPWRMDTSEWKRVTETRPVKKPRKGKRQGMPYDWVWDTGSWRRAWVD